MIQIYDGRKHFYQWDLNRKLIIEDASVKEVHFCNRTDNCSLVCKPYLENGQYLVDVPNILLQTAWKIRVYAYVGYTKHEECFEVIARTKPADYIYTETEILTWEELEKKLEDKPGVKTEAGEVFNNYSDNKAGIKGYYYSSIEFKNKVIILSKKQGYGEKVEPFDVPYQVGDIVSMVSGSKFYNCATITAIDKNRITVDKLPIGYIPDEANPDIDDYSFYVMSKPDVGEVQLGHYSHAEGEVTQALERAAHAEGRKTKAYGQYAHAEGRETEASYCSHAEGFKTKASGFYSHAEGMYNKAEVEAAHAEGRENTANGWCSHAEGYENFATQSHAHVEGWRNTASGLASHAEGKGTEAKAEYTHAEGNGTVASAQSAHAEGQTCQATGMYGSHAEGFSSMASGEASHAENRATKAIGKYAHAEGEFSEAHGQSSHAEGFTTKANGNQSHAEGRYSEANAVASHAEGTGTKANADASHAEGANTEANGWASHSEGSGTIAAGKAQHTQGTFNIIDNANKYADIVGNGASTNTRSNAYTLDWNGNGWFAGSVEATAIILKAPNGTRYKITVDNSGNLTTVKA